MRLFFVILMLSLTTSASFAGDQIKVLIIDGVNNHDWKNTTKANKATLEATGRFKVDVSTSPSRGAPKEEWDAWCPKFSDYQVVVSNFNSGERTIWSGKMKSDFEKFVREGGGFVPMHAADNSSGDWVAYNEMIGMGGWGGREAGKSGYLLRLIDGKWQPSSPNEGLSGEHADMREFAVVHDKPSHPILKGLPTEWMHATDELYSALRGPAKNVEVLAHSFSLLTKENEPTFFLITYGKGKVFHMPLGHWDDESEPYGAALHCVGFQTLLARGTEYVATGKVTIGIPDSFPTKDKAVAIAPDKVKWPATQSTESGDYGDLVSLFAKFRGLQEPKVIDGVPDYTPAAIAEQRRGLRVFQKRLAAMDIADWPVSQQVDYHLVRAEMNGLDFYQRVLKPWARDPGFYLQTQAGAGPTRGNVLRIRQLPIPKEEIEEVRTKLKAVPEIFKQAKTNLTESAADLALCAIHYMNGEISLYRRIVAAMEEHHPELVADARHALAAVEDYGQWLNENRDRMTAPAGVGKENYNWWIKNVQLLPYTWEECFDIVMHEDYRMITTLELERNRNRHLPELQPVETQAEHHRRRDQALRFVMKFLKEEEIMTIPDYLDIEGYLYRGPLSTPEEWPRKRDFFEQTGDREPLPEQTHEFIGHYFDGKRFQQEYRHRDFLPLRGTDRFYAIEMIRSEGWAFWLEEMLMHAGYLDTRPERGREIVYLQAAFRTCRAVADLKMHNNEFSLNDAIEYCVECAPNRWLLPDGPHVWYEMETNLRFVGWHMGMVVGKFQFNKLFRDCAKQRGDDFNLREFMDEFLAAGMIPMSLIRWEMTGHDDEIKELWQ